MRLGESLAALRESAVGSFGEWVLRGVGQIFLQNNPLSGALFLLAIFLSSWFSGVDAIIGAVIATGTGVLLGVPRDSLANGLYGFNGALTAIALTVFVAHGWKLVVYVIIAAAASAVLTAALQNFLHSSHIPGLTAGFVATTWLFVAALRQFAHLAPHSGSVLEAHLPRVAHQPTGPLDFHGLVDGFFNGIAQVVLQTGVWSGVIILVGLLVNSRITALAAAVGSAVGLVTAWILGLPAYVLTDGLAGYNSVLTVIALGGLYYVLTVRSAVLAVLAGAVTVIAHGSMMTILAPVGLPVITAPFVLITWSCLFAASSLTALRPVHPADASTPEGNLAHAVRPWSSANPYGFHHD